MIRVSAFLTIDAGIDEVFDFLADLRNYPSFLPPVFHDFLFPGPRTGGTGGRMDFHLDLGRRRRRIEAELTEVVPSRKVELRDRSAKPRFAIVWRLMFISQDTKITLEIHSQPAGWKLGGLLSGRALTRELERICRQCADALRQKMAEPFGSSSSPLSAAEAAEKPKEG